MTSPTIARREKPQLVEGLEAEDAGAVHGRADHVVLFEHGDREASLGERTRGDQPSGTAADHDDVTGPILRIVCNACVVSTCVLWTPMCPES